MTVEEMNILQFLIRHVIEIALDQLFHLRHGLLDLFWSPKALLQRLEALGKIAV
jgi:hypothetical protein